MDFDEMFNDVITRQPKSTARVLDCLVDGSRSVTEIVSLFDNTKGGHISEAFAQLEEAGFVSSDVGINPLTGTERREKRYRLKVAAGNSIRTALVYAGHHLARTVEADGYFDTIVPFSHILGILPEK